APGVAACSWICDETARERAIVFRVHRKAKHAWKTSSEIGFYIGERLRCRRPDRVKAEVSEALVIRAKRITEGLRFDIEFRCVVGPIPLRWSTEQDKRLHCRSEVRSSITR